jgi:hypothetical protein
LWFGSLNYFEWSDSKSRNPETVYNFGDEYNRLRTLSGFSGFDSLPLPFQSRRFVESRRSEEVGG